MHEIDHEQYTFCSLNRSVPVLSERFVEDEALSERASFNDLYLAQPGR